MKQAGAGFSVAADIFFCGKKTVCAKMFSFMIKLFLSAKIETYLPTKNIPFPSFSRVYYRGQREFSIPGILDESQLHFFSLDHEK